MRGSTGLCVLQSIHKLPTVVASESTVSTLVRAYTGVAQFHGKNSCIHGRNKGLGNHHSGMPITKKREELIMGQTKHGRAVVALVAFLMAGLLSWPSTRLTPL